MLSDILGLVVGFSFMFAAIGFSTILLRHNLVSPTASRKIIHIWVSHWWIIAMVFFNSTLAACIVPAAFILINALALRLNFFKAMDGDDRLRNLGTVYFPISLLVLVLLCWSGPLPVWVGGAAILVLGWSDGLAALVGQKTRLGEFRVYGRTKSAAGVVTMFVAALAVALAFTLVYAAKLGGFLPVLGVSALVAAAATAVELFTPFGMDNLTVPAAVAALYAILLI